MSLSKLFSRYREFVEKNPIAAKQVESVIEIFTFCRVPRASEVLNEGLRAFVCLIQLAHDILLRRYHALPISTTRVVSILKIALQILDYIQCFLEKISFFISGDTARWAMVASVQLSKTVIRVLLLLCYKQGMATSPPVPPLDRKRDIEYAVKLKTLRHQKRAQATFTLKSGRELRSLDCTPPLRKRRWCETKTVDPMERMEQKFSFEPTQLKGSQLTGEILYLMTPVMHLATMKLFGTNSWKPFFIALATDLLSLQQQQWQGGKLQRTEQLELSRRSRALAAYLLRAPLYQTHIKSKLQLLKKGFMDTFPFISFLDGFIEYELDELQTTYFRTWGSH